MEPVRTNAGDSRPPCHRHLAAIAWTLFIGSFFLPAYGDMFGWQCAWASLVAWLSLFQGVFDEGKLFGLHLMMLSLTNLFVLTSPFFLLRRTCSPRALRWLRRGALASVILTCTFLLELIEGIGDVKIGYFVWVMSFAVLGVSIMRGGIGSKG